jgi:hypothetical protein
MMKWRTDLESERKIGQGSMFKFYEMSKMFFTTIYNVVIDC